MPDASTLQSLLKRGAMSKTEILQLLGINESELQEWISTLHSEIIEFGSDKNTGYALRRKIREYDEFPIWEISKEGSAERIGNLIPIQPSGCVVLWGRGKLAKQSTFSQGLLWWLYDMRPQGFLGRAFAKQNAEYLKLPLDFKLWSDDDILVGILHFGLDVVGNFIITNNLTIQQLLNVLQRRSASVNSTEYPSLASQALGFEVIGSSAAGEQPKFTAIIEKPDTTHVIVKFTAPEKNAITQRWASLLQAEYLASKVLKEAGFASANSDFLEINNQYFLEVERFDRIGLYGRKGLVSLAAIDSEFVGQADATWSIQAIKLQKQGLISAQDAETMQKLEAFGRMIGNADMHLGNLSFFHEQTTNLRLAPVYDMLPMLFAPRTSGHIPNEVPEIRLVTPPAIEYWQEMFPIALRYWHELITLSQPDETFKLMAEKFIERLNELKAKLGL
jgi:biotin operon repressor